MFSQNSPSPTPTPTTWTLGRHLPKTLESRLFLGSALYPSLSDFKESVLKSQSQVVTVSVRRTWAQSPDKAAQFWEILKELQLSHGVHFLPNTAGCLSAQEAIQTAHMAREIFNTSWIKLEVITDTTTLSPNPVELVKAASTLNLEGFDVFPYTSDDLGLSMNLADAGCTILMPGGSPIGTGLGPLNPYALSRFRHFFPQNEFTLVLDAGIGLPHHAAQVMEMGFDAVLANSAVARALNPALFAESLKLAVISGHLGFLSGPMKSQQDPSPSTPLLEKPFWHQE